MGCTGCTPREDAVEQAKRSARATAEGTNGRISYDEALAQELAAMAPMAPLDAGPAPEPDEEV